MKHAGLISNNAQEVSDLEAFEFDKCAWYISYHYIPRTFWGIHINFSCLESVANELYNKCKNLIGDSSGAKKAAFLYLFTHELFHYIVDNACSIMEIVTKDPHIYKKYSRDVYEKLYATSQCVEEALANRFLYGRSKSVHIQENYLFQALKKHPAGYRDFDQYLGKNFRYGRRI